MSSKPRSIRRGGANGKNANTTIPKAPDSNMALRVTTYAAGCSTTNHNSVTAITGQ